LLSSLGESDPTLKTFLLSDRDRFLVVEHAQWPSIAATVRIQYINSNETCILPVAVGGV
jgi:hypothetical protein